MRKFLILSALVLGLVACDKEKSEETVATDTVTTETAQDAVSEPDAATPSDDATASDDTAAVAPADTSVAD